MSATIERDTVEGQDGGLPPTHEREFALELSVAELAQDNQQMGIFNPVAYEQMNKGFRDHLFQEILVVNVLDLNKPEDEAQHWGVIDGHTRLKFAYDQDHETIACLNATEVVMAKLGITDERNYLFPHEYLRATVEHTLIHPEYAPDRVAAHFMNTWQSMVGPVSDAFSATLAMQYLERHRSDKSINGKKVGQFLRELPITFDDDESFVRTLNTCRHGLETMDSVIRQLNIRHGVLYESAVGLFVTGEGISGGEPAVKREIHSLVDILQAGVPADTTLQIKEQISAAAIAALRSLSPRIGVRHAVSEVTWTIQTRTMPWDQKLAALQSGGSPVEYHKQNLAKQQGQATQKSGEIKPRIKTGEAEQTESTEAYAKLLLSRLRRNPDVDYTAEGLATFQSLSAVLNKILSKNSVPK